MAMASKIIPNTFFMMAIPPTPKKFSILLRNFNTTYTTITLRMIAMMMDNKLNSALIESNVVKVPVPAISGKAKGTTLAVAGMVSWKFEYQGSFQMQQ
jgi:hypothetical protein